MKGVFKKIDGEHKEFIFNARKVFKKNIPPQKGTLVKASKWYKDADVSLALENLVISAGEILYNNGFKIDLDTWYVNFHRYDMEGEREVRKIVWHTDDISYDGTSSVGAPVHTLIAYLEKEMAIKGGNLMLKSDDGKLTQVEYIKTGTIILMKGNILHQPEPMGGYGTRSSMIFQFKRMP